MQVRDDRVRSPQNDQSTVDEVLREHAHRRALGEADPCGRGVLADRPLEACGPETGEETTVDRLALDDPLGPEVAVGQDRGRAVSVDDLAEAARDLVEGLIPADPHELASALRTNATQRVEDAVGAVDALEVVVDLGTQATTGERMILGPGEIDRDPVLDRNLPGAGVRAVVRARALDDDRQRSILCGDHEAASSV